MRPNWIQRNWRRINNKWIVQKEPFHFENPEFSMYWETERPKRRRGNKLKSLSTRQNGDISWNYVILGVVPSPEILDGVESRPSSHNCPLTAGRLMLLTISDLWSASLPLKNRRFPEEKGRCLWMRKTPERFRIVRHRGKTMRSSIRGLRPD